MLKQPEQCMVVYHWWCDHWVTLPYRDMANPVVLAIASLRAHNKTVPITVLDLSDIDRKPTDWGGFPELLRFNVVKWKPLLSMGLPKSSKICSRVWDIWDFAKQIPQNKILFTDADIFWLKNPFPLAKEDDGKLLKFYCSTNTGVWYFDKTQEQVAKTIAAWKSIMARVFIDDKDFFEEFCVEMPLAKNNFHEEAAFNYLIRKQPEFLNPVGVGENFIISSLRIRKIAIDKIKCLHAISSEVGGMNKARICFMIDELREVISKSLTYDEQVKIYGDFSQIKTLSIDDFKKMSIEEAESLRDKIR